MKLNLILEQNYRQQAFQLIFLQAPRTEGFFFWFSFLFPKLITYLTPQIITPVDFDL